MVVGDFYEMDDCLVLVMEHDASLRQVLADFVRFLGYGVQVTANAEEAMAVAREEHPAAIVLDVSFPYGNDYRLLERFNRDPATCEVPLIALHDVLPSSLAEPLEVSANIDVLSRPFELGDLEDALSRRVAPKSA